MRDEAIRVRAIPWNHVEPVGDDWYRRRWHVLFTGPPDLTTLQPSTGRLDDRGATSHVVCVVLPDGANAVRVDVFVGYAGSPVDKSVTQLEAETISYDSLLLQRIVACGPGPVIINGYERHPILYMAKEREAPTDAVE